MALPEAFANKIAASLERGVTRDLYDLFLFEPMTRFDGETLQGRLAQLEIDQIRPRWPPENRTGLLLLIRASVSRIIQRMQLLT